MTFDSLKKAVSGALAKAKNAIKNSAIVKKVENKLISAVKGSTANTKKCINVKKSAENVAQKAIQIGKNVALNMASQRGKTKSNAGKSASKIVENAVKKVNSAVASAISGSVVAATKILATSSGTSKLRSAVIGATGTTVCSDAIISKGKKQTNGKINVANLPVYNRAGNYIEGQKVKVKGLDGKWYVGTVKADGYIGTGGARQFKFVPDNLGAYNKGMDVTKTDFYKFCQKKETREKIDFAAGFTLLDTPFDAVNFINGKNVVTGDEQSRWASAAYIALPGIFDVGAKQFVKHSDDIGEFIVKKSDGIIDTSKKVELLNGKFKDAKLEADYEKYIKRKNKEGKTPRTRKDWKETRDYWLNDSPMARGNKFNKTAEKNEWYDYYEVNLENGKRLDSYDPIKKEIISRKATDLNDIDISTFEKYLKELDNKYKPGTKIRSNKYKEIDGKVLEGKYVLEIPDSNKAYSDIDKYVKLAKEKYNVEIRFRSDG